MTHPAAWDESPESATLGNGDPLTEYRRRKLELAELIRAGMTIAQERRDGEREYEARDLLARLAEDRFQLAVVGQFSRGKSTLMNAILGAAYLPTGGLPMTSVVTTVNYGSAPRVEVRRAGGAVPIETSLDQLVRFVAQASHEREEQHVVSAEVEVPAAILRLGFSFVDTPGIGSAITANTATTEHYLPDADAVVFVTSFDAPLSEAEIGFLAQVRRHVEKLFLVINKLDLVAAAEAETVTRYVRERLGEATGNAEIRIFATSARLALNSRASGDQAGLAISGVPSLEQELVHFLTAEKARVFMRQTAWRATRLLARQSVDLELGRRAQIAYVDGHEPTSERLEARLAGRLEEVRGLAAELCGRVSSLLPKALPEHFGPPATETNRTAVAELERRLPPPDARTPRAELQASVTEAVQAITALLEGWDERCLPALRGLVFRVAGDQIKELLERSRTVEQLAAETFDLSPAGADLDPPGSSPAELPVLTAPHVAFDAQLALSRRASPAGTTRRWDRARRRLLGEAERAVAGYLHEAQDALEQTAYDWAKELGAYVERQARRSAEQVLERMRNPGSDRHVALLEHTARRVTALREELLAWNPAPTVSEEQALPAVIPERTAVPVTAQCEICQTIGGIPFDFLAHAQYVLATSEESRAEHAANGGYCALHTWLYAQVAEPVGTALAYAKLTEAAARSLRAARDSPSSAQALLDALAHFLPDSDRCPVCVTLAAAERSAIDRVVADLHVDSGDEAPILCLPHAAAVLAVAPDAARRSWLVGKLADSLERIAEDTQTFALKRQSLRRSLLNDEELNACLHAISRVAGNRELARPWRTDEDDRLQW